MRKVVANTTPLIALADIGYLDLLHCLYKEIIIPKAVLDEIESEPAKSLVKNASWIKPISIRNVDDKRLFKSRLHAGEVEAIILAEEKAADLLIMDDNTAKKTAKFLGFHVTGTLGVLVKAKQEGYIEEVKPLLDLLTENSFYIDQNTRQLILKMSKEL